jgi:hypothetical protein
MAVQMISRFATLDMPNDHPTTQAATLAGMGSLPVSINKS